jgi:hypothetical protein
MLSWPENPADSEPVNIPLTTKGRHTDTHGPGGWSVPWNRKMRMAIMAFVDGAVMAPTNSTVLKRRAATANVDRLLLN